MPACPTTRPGWRNWLRGSAWCHEAGINLVAERVETARDLLTLAEVGIEWAQGYSLARPTEL